MCQLDSIMSTVSTAFVISSVSFSGCQSFILQHNQRHPSGCCRYRQRKLKAQDQRQHKLASTKGSCLTGRTVVLYWGGDVRLEIELQNLVACGCLLLDDLAGVPQLLFLVCFLVGSLINEHKWTTEPQQFFCSHLRPLHQDHRPTSPSNPAVYQDGASDAASAALTSAQELQEPGNRKQLFLVDSRWTPASVFSVKVTCVRIRDIQVQVAVIGFPWFFRMQHWKQSFIWLWCPQGRMSLDIKGERKLFDVVSIPFVESSSRDCGTLDQGIARQREDGWSRSRSTGTLLHLHVAAW